MVRCGLIYTRRMLPIPRREWIEAIQHDFETRLKWCTTSTYDKANHSPKITTPDGTDITVRSGVKVTLRATVVDNDKEDREAMWNLNYALYQQYGMTKERFMSSEGPKGTGWNAGWYQDPLAGSYKGFIILPGMGRGEVSFTAPKVDKEETIHVILEVTDNGIPSLTSYKRFIVTVKP